MLVGAVILTGTVTFSYAQESVTIGGIMPISGVVAYDGQCKQNGAILAREEINAKGGVLGRPVQVLVEDGSCVPAKSVAAAEKLITTHKVPAIIGAHCSSSTGAVMEVAKKYKVPQVSAVSTATNLTEQGNSYFFRAADRMDMMAAAFAPFIIKEAAKKKIAFLVVNDEWGRTVVEEYGKNLKKLGGEVVATEIFDRADTDLFPYITKIKARNPDIVITAANTQHAAAVTKQLRQMDVQAKLMGEGAFASDSYYKLVGDLAEGVFCMVEYVPTIDSPVNNAFVQKYKQRFGELPNKFSAAGYTDTWIVANAIALAKSTDPSKVRDALTKTNYNGLTGNYVFDQKGQAYNFDVYLTQNKKGLPVVMNVAKISKP
jgi:branched-chain amino acid transport system substrate-binding protein